MLTNEPHAELFIGITSWNSASFLPLCIESLKKSVIGPSTRVVVFDNLSQDGSADLAKHHGAQVISNKLNQADALNVLANLSKSKYTLLIHSDVVFLSDQWFELCRSKINSTNILISPEDIGCGPFTRPFGMNMPESSFLFFKTKGLNKLKQRLYWRRKGFGLWPKLLDFYGPHITHHLPNIIRNGNFTWKKMLVHCSDLQSEPFYVPNFKPDVWSDELAYLRYGLGNFYSLDGIITHYHNWYERLDKNIDDDSTQSTSVNSRGFPLAYIKRYTQRFISDYSNDTIVLPEAIKSNRKPTAL